MKHLVKILFLAVGLLTFSGLSYSAGKADVKVTSSKDAAGVKISFKTVAGDGLAVNPEGPWKLEIKSATGVKFAAMEYKRSDWKQDIAGFEVPATLENGAKKANVTFKMTTFVCTKDKSMCYREVVEGKSDISL